jgi:CRP/FNR family transcriptional regulator, dissimilatory nitrate respiration regulator
MPDKISIREILTGIPIFSGLSDIYLDKLATIAIERRFSKNALIFREGDESDGFYIVLEGEVRVYRMSPAGKQKILHVFGPGQPIGEVAVFSGQRFPAYAQVNTDSRALYFSKTSFVALASADPTLLLNLLAVLSKRLRNFADQIESITLKEVPTRIAAYLLSLAFEQGRPDQIELHVSKSQLASILGTIPETLSRALARLSAGGVIAVDGRHISFLNRDKLTDLAEGRGESE